MLPTNEASTLYIEKSILYFNLSNRVHQNSSKHVTQHVYVTSNEEIKEGDWYYIPSMNIVQQADILPLSFKDSQKIIACSDPKLTRIQPNDSINKLFNAVDRLSIPFLQAYVREYNASTPITQCMVEYYNLDVNSDGQPVEFRLNLRKDGTIITHPAHAKTYTEEELHMNMQYYMEYCKLMNTYVTPQNWIRDHSPFTKHH